jgi:hypothetical protein
VTKQLVRAIDKMNNHALKVLRRRDSRRRQDYLLPTWPSETGSHR